MRNLTRRAFGFGLAVAPAVAIPAVIAAKPLSGAVAPVAMQDAPAELSIEVLKAQLGAALSKKWGRPVRLSDIGSNGECAPVFMVASQA